MKSALQRWLGMLGLSINKLCIQRSLKILSLFSGVDSFNGLISDKSLLNHAAQRWAVLVANFVVELQTLVEITPPPINAISEIVWCGARNVLVASRDCPLRNSPEMLCIFVTSSASSKVMGGNIEGIRFASIVFPLPGGPTIRMLWEPAAATSSARFAYSCP